MKSRTYVVGPGQVSGNLNLGQFLASCRINAGLTKPKAAIDLEVSEEYIRLIEKGKRTPALGMAIKMFNLYGTQYSQEESTLTVGHVIIEFTSRIKEARYTRYTNRKSSLSRNELIGQIVKALVVADDDTLKKIYSKLVKNA